MNILTYAIGERYQKYVDRNLTTQPGLIVDSHPSIDAPKIGKIGSVLRLPDDMVGPVVFIDADLVLLRALDPQDFRLAVDAGADIAGVIIPRYSVNWLRVALQDSLKKFRPVRYVPYFNSGILWWPDVATAKRISREWLTSSLEMVRAEGWVRDELTLSFVMSQNDWKSEQIPNRLNCPFLKCDTVGWHDLKKTLPVDRSEQDAMLGIRSEEEDYSGAERIALLTHR